MNPNDPPCPIIVPFGRGDDIVAHLYCGGSQVEVLKTLKSHSVHIVIPPITEGCHTEVARLLNQKCGCPTGPDHLQQLLDFFQAGCCPVCRVPVSEGFNVLSMTELVIRDCRCANDDIVPCTVLDFNPGDGAKAVTVLKAGLHYIGIYSDPQDLGNVCRKIEEARLMEDPE